MYSQKVHCPKGVEGSKSTGQSLEGFWLSPAKVAQSMGISRTEVLRRIWADKLQAAIQLDQFGRKRWKVLLTPSDATRADTKGLVAQWQESLRNGWLTGKPLSEKTVVAHFYGLGLFYKYRHYLFENLLLDVLTPDEVALAVSKIPHDIKKRNDHFGMKEKLFYGVLSFHRFLVKKGLAKDAVEAFRRVKPKRVYKRAKPKVFITQLNYCLEELEHERFKLVAKAFAYTGLRLTEMVRLQLMDIDFANKTLFVRHGKGFKERQTGILPEALPVLQALAEGATSSRSFLIRGRGGDGVKPVTVQKLFYRCCGGLSVKFSPHSLRHTFACLLDEKGFSVPLIQLALGHSNIETTMRYLGVNQRRLVAKMMGCPVLSDS